MLVTGCWWVDIYDWCLANSCPPVHKCPSQAMSVHSLTSTTPLLIVLCAMSVVDFGHVRPREEPVLLCWIVTLVEIMERTYGMVILTPSGLPQGWCVGSGVMAFKCSTRSQLQVIQSTVQNTSSTTLTGQCYQFLVKRAFIMMHV